MANRNIIISNEDGRVAFSNSSSIYIDDLTDKLYVKQLSSSATIQVNFLSNGTQLLSTSGDGTVQAISPGLTNDSALVWNGSSWISSNIVLQKYAGNAGGDLSGIYPNPKVNSVANVNSGVLSVKNGGLGISVSEANRSSRVILKASGSINPVITSVTASSELSGTVLTNISGTWKFTRPAYAPDVRLYTGSVGNNTFLWKKPEIANFARIILQGAGGGGGTGGATYNGSGGGSGGFTDIIINVSNLSSVAVTVGLGGTSGVAGGTTSFGSYTATGGGAGSMSSNSTNGGTAGTGLTKNGGRGAASNTTAADTVYDMPSGGGSGGGLSRGTIVTYLIGGNKNFGYTTTTDGINLSSILVVASGSAGGATPVQPGFGAGGGGGSLGKAGGRGGDGYALIISW